ncbi:glycoside hydrolase family 43 protein [Hymenobacter aerilatus]|uniref:Glycoside hydrolase family 43 protein n=1 Tax=Hymenobacter aerilatus TaxID=2932251 RepID=A0A8T9T362_9BACT|nr:glycoside hydrolase family 43 protein [Hymenobacter aerilatus]UOR07604.1 glycoside hydrolase family 43 protein [Hymenobacter aerilatus]
MTLLTSSRTLPPTRSIAPARWLSSLLLSVALLGGVGGCTRPAATTPADTAAATAPEATFTNPLLPSGADPWSIYHDGYYYYTHTTGRNITLWKTKSLSQLGTAEKRVVWTPPATGPNSREIWAPELHYLRGKWYVYYAADAGTNQTHRLWVLENASPDPLQGTWTDKGQLTDTTNKWAIDGSIFEHNKELYMVWSGWEGDVNGRQNIYLAHLKNPWTVDGPRVLVSTPTYAWEKDGDLGATSNPPHVDVNEGPEVLSHGNKLYLIYSASGCWTDSYKLGMLTASAKSDLTKPESWTKSPEPVFQANPTNGVYAPGHNSFFKSPDGKQDWILYHANNQPGQGCGGFRSPRAQRFTWNTDGTPNFGVPVATGTPLARPSGEK